MLRKLFVPIAGALLLLLSSDATAVDEAACCLASTSRLDALLNPTKGSDERFFTTPGGPPNVLVLIDTSGSMNEWPSSWPTAKGCGLGVHPGFAAGYDNTVSYAGLWTSVTANGGLGAEHPDWFDRSKFYDVPADNDSYGTNFSSSGSPSGSNWTTAALACSSIAGISAGDQSACEACLGAGASGKGYYVYDSTTKRAKGNFLNYHAPKDSGAMIVLSQVVKSIRTVRMGLMTFAQWTGTNKCFQVQDGPAACACMLDEMGPSCGSSFPLNTSSVDSNRNSILNNIAGNRTWSGNGCGTPLASFLYAAGHYFRNTTADGFTDSFQTLLGDGFPTDSDFNEVLVQDKKSICGSCGFNAILLISDGEANNEFITPPAAITDVPVLNCDGALACASNLDEIARYLWTHDLRADYANTQKVATYSIGLGTNAAATKLLKSTARVGGGKYYTANSTSELAGAIMQIFDDIAARNTAFSAASVGSVQSGSTGAAALVPRMFPTNNLPWLGQLWRFELFNEFVRDEDENSDGDKNDIFIIDKDGDIITENDESVFVKPDGTAAEPFWEARTRLVSNGHASRNLWTVLDVGGPAGDEVQDGALTHQDPLHGFTVANAATLAPYLGIVGTAFCPTLGGADGTMLTKFGLTQAAAGTLLGLPVTTQVELDDLCVKALILYVRGQDLRDENDDASRTDTRESAMGDIFHSSPVVVTPPVDKFLCDLGLSNQCIRTLYAGSPATPLASYANEANCASTKTRNAYESYAYQNRKRDKLVLVGANDGVLHAFHNGSATEDCTSGESLISYDITGLATGAGTGDEVWGFIPPDLLPRLQEMVSGHAYYVDGDLMVRDIWVDENNDGTKDNTEYHTMVIASEGRGGTHYLALEVLFDVDRLHSQNQPGFRWMYPQPCSDESQLFGKTFYSLSPKPPPIGPVLVNRATLASGPAGVPRTGPNGIVNTLETWVVALSGGWSPMLEKGRGIYLVDAWYGQVNGRADNLWWKFAFNQSASSEQNTPAKALTHSIAAPVAMIDYGSNSEPGQDGFFDTAVVGDTGGKIWIARLSEAGKVTGSNPNKLITNWSAARLFEMDRDGVVEEADEDLVVTGAKSTANEWPFYYLPAVGISGQQMRVFMGSGNRYALLEQSAGVCRFDNPLACSKYRCGEVKTVFTEQKNTMNITKDETHWGNRKFVHGKLESSSAAHSICGTPGGAASITAGFSDFKVNNCDPSSGPNVDFGQVNQAQVSCSQTADAGSFNCSRTYTVAPVLQDLVIENAYTTGLGMNRFFGVWAYGGHADRQFEEWKDTAGALSAKSFDIRRLSDRNVAFPTAGDLKNVTAVACDNAGTCTNPVGTGTWGWVLDYPALDHKTASGAAVLASCVLWSSLNPPAAGDTGMCGATGQPKSRFIQADFTTGAPNCAAGFQGTDGGWARFQERSVVAPPPELSATIQLSSTGQVKFSALLIEPGKDQATEADISTGQDNLQLVYELPISRSLHQCRHVMDGGCVNAPP